MVSGTSSENFRSLQWKLWTWHAFEVRALSHNYDSALSERGITSDNKLMNLNEIGLFRIVIGVSKGTHDNYHEIWWKYCFGTKIYWYIWISGGYEGEVHFLFIIQKNGKRLRAWPILESNSTSFWYKKFFPRMNNKNFTRRGPKGAPLLFLYEVSILVIIDFIAILLTPGIFLIQIVNTNNTNMYLIRFHRKNIIKMFPKV